MDLGQDESQQKVDSDVHRKKDCDQEVDNPQMAPDQEMDLGQDESQQKVDSDVHRKKDCDQEVDNLQTAPEQEMDLGLNESQQNDQNRPKIIQTT